MLWALPDRAMYQPKLKEHREAQGFELRHVYDTSINALESLRRVRLGPRKEGLTGKLAILLDPVEEDQP